MNAEITINIALLQIQAMGSKNQNMEKGLECCRRAKQLGADICVFPEMWNDGYQIPENTEELEKLFQVTIKIKPETKEKLDWLKFTQKKKFMELAEEAFEDIYKKYGGK